MTTHDLSEYSDATLLARIFELEDGEERFCDCANYPDTCELDNLEALYNELDSRLESSIATYTRPGSRGSHSENGGGADEGSA